MNNSLDPASTPSTQIKRFNKWPMIIGMLLILLVIGGFYMMVQERGNPNYNTTSEKQEYSSMADLAAYYLKGKPKSGVINERKEEVLAPLPAVEPPKTIEQIQKEVSLPSEPITIPPQQQEVMDAEKPKTWKQLQEERIRSAKQDKYEAAINVSTGIQKSKATSGSGTNNNNRYNPANIQQDLRRALSQNGNRSTQGSSGGLGGIEQILSGLGGSGSGGSNEQSRSSINEGFFNKEVGKTTYLDNTRTAPRSKLEMRTGTIIPAILITEINTQLPSMILAQVSENVFDTATGNYLLIPQGSRLVGEYNSNTSYGQERAAIIWSRLIYPDASAIELGNMAGSDAQGRAGLADKVNNHYGKIFTAAILSSVLDYGVAQTNTSVFQTDDSFGGSLGKSVTKVTTKIIDKTLNIPPTITIRSGMRMNVMVNKDIVFPKTWRDQYEPMMR